MVRISFLLPCYKVEKYIQACLDSIYKIDIPENEFEVLCFNDCSPDRTVDIIEENMKHRKNLHLYHAKENVGSGGGRNALLKVANGRYIWYVDPDDMIIPEVVSSMLKQAESNALDVLMFNFCDMNEAGDEKNQGSYFKDTDILDGLSFIDHVFGHDIVRHMGYPVRFLIRREYLTNSGLLFPEKVVFQDTVWMPKLIINACRIQASNIVAYIYWHHETSVCGAFDKSYPAKSIYTRCITVTHQLLDFALELEEKRDKDERYHEYATVFHDFAQSYYLNKLPLFLFRTRREECKKFYAIAKVNGISQRVLALANTLTRMVLLPCVGYYICNIMALVYKLTHKHS